MSCRAVVWYRRVTPWFATDPYLVAKFEFLRRAMQAMSPEMDAAFFDRLYRQLQEGQIDEADLRTLEREDNLFPDLDHRVYAV